MEEKIAAECGIEKAYFAPSSKGALSEWHLWRIWRKITKVFTRIQTFESAILAKMTNLVNY